MITVPDYILFNLISKTDDLELYRATREFDGLRVLLKIHTTPNPSLVISHHLEHEYEIARNLDSNLIARPIALEHHSGKTVLVLEQGPTRNLASMLDSPMDIQTFMQIAIGITAALTELHRHELIHKDLKPEHILLNDEGHVWLTGLGIASRLPKEHLVPEPPEAINGTLAYMAPEQTGRMNRSIDSRSDLYALGVTFYQMLTGVLPFTASDPMEWIHCHIARQPTPPSQRMPNLPETLSEMVMRLLVKNPEERYQSSSGLGADLQHCLANWESKGCISPFLPGERDVTDHLLIPEKLYGRQAEIDTLLAAFDRVMASGIPEIVMVSGYSGIGKSSVVHELHKALVSPRGLFASGKFDQYKRDIPYATLIQALQTLVHQILGKSEADITVWRDAIQASVNPNGQLIVNLIPEVELIIGKQPSVPHVPPQEARNRFQMVLLQFVGVFAAPDHPLVLFLDDLQWLDAATLDLIEQLATGQEVRHLLLIGAYRDNEVGPTHPLIRILKAIRKRGGGVQDILLAPLTIDDVGNLVSDALHCDRECALPLAKLVYEKTGGNPFFTIQFMTALAEEKLLAFDQDDGRWIWDLPRIHAKGFTDNVVDLMVAKLGRLPVETQEVLKQFACLGNVARIATLTKVCELAEDALHAAFWEAARAGLIVRLEDAYAFLHDRVQEAAYALVPESQRRELHLKIGRLLLAQFPLEALEERVFDVVDQFNRCVELVTNAEEREMLRRLNTAAGRKARGAVAYASGRRYLEQAMALLPPDHWNVCYAESLSLHVELAECEYLVGNFQRADALLTSALEKARSTLDLANVYRLRLRLYPVSGRYLEAVEIAFEALRLFDVTFPRTDEDAHAATEIELRLVPENLQGRRIIDLLDIPLVSDAETRALISLLADVMPLIFLVRPDIWALFTAKSVNICMLRGHGDESSFLYSNYAMSLAFDIRNILTAQQFSEMAIKLNEQTPGAGPMRGKVLFLHSITIIFWRHHIASSLPLLEQAFQACLDFGDLGYGGYLTYHAIWHHLENGDPLERVVEVARRYVAFARQHRIDTVFHVDRLEEQFALCLQGKTQSLTDFSDSDFDEDISVAAIEQAGFGLGLAFYQIMKLVAAFFDERYDKALEWVDRMSSSMLYVSSFVNGPTLHFYHALTLAALHADAPAEQQQQFKQTIAEILEKLKTWADNCPENFTNRYLLVSAEIARIEERDMEAMRLYDQAIRSARDNNFVHQKALAAEVASRFYRARGFDRIADAYLHDSCTCYAHWGAQGKVRQLEQCYPQLHETTLPTPADTAATIAGEIDALAVVQASRAISGEILLDNLIKTLMRTVLTIAGGQHAYLLLTRDEGLSLAAEARVENQIVVVQILNEPGLPEALFPASIVNYVIRSQDKVLLDDATSPNPYSTDEYFSCRHPKSVLCFPITKQAALTGLFYLENDLATHVFTPDRLTVLELLAAQAAIALENALIYEALRQGEQKFRAIFDQTFQFIGVLSVDGKVLQANQTALQFAGVSEDTVLGKPFWETPWWAHSTELQQRLRAAVQKAAKGKLVRFEATHTTPDGEVHYIDFSLKPVTDTEGRTVQLITEGRDITERKQAEEALKKSETLLNTTQQLTKVGGWEFDVKSGKSFWTEELYRIHEMPNNQGIDHIKESMACYQPEDRKTINKAFRRACEQGESYDLELPFTTCAGKSLWIRTTAQPVFEEGKVVRLVGNMIDITERKRTELELRRLTLFQQTILNSAAYSIVSTTLNGIITGFNPAAERLLGYTAAEVVGQQTPSIWHDPQEIKQHALRLSKELGEIIQPGFDVFTARPKRNLPEEREWTFIRKDGTRLPVSLSVTALRNDSGHIIGFLGMIYDLTERKRAEQEIHQLNQELEQRVQQRTEQLETANKELEAFSYSVSHDLRAPLRSISGFSQILMEEYQDKLDTTGKNYLQRISTATQRLGQLIDDMLDLSRVSRVEMSAQQVNLSILAIEISNNLKETQPERQVNFIIQEDIKVHGDRGLLQIVLENLIGNAWKFTSNKPSATIEFGTLQQDNEQVFFVRDNGTGFDMKYAQKLFGAFQRLHDSREFPGTGIGLATVQRIIHRHGGTVWAEGEVKNPTSGKAGGATFYFTIPLLT